MSHGSKKQNPLVALLKADPKPKHPKLKKGLIGVGVLTVLIATLTRKRGDL